MKKVAIFLINFYQTFLSFDRGLLRVFAPNGACRYPISCSEYTKHSIIRHGLLRGSVIGIKRVWSCR